RKIARNLHISRITVHRLLERPRPTAAPLARPPRPRGLDSPKLRPFASYHPRALAGGLHQRPATVSPGERARWLCLPVRSTPSPGKRKRLSMWSWLRTTALDRGYELR